jgi:hypothetical protein
MTPLTLVDQRTYNLLIAYAWDHIDEDVEHSIPKAALRGTHESNDRLSDTIRRLMAGQVEVRIVRDGKRYLQSVHLLAAVARPEDEEEDGNVYYRFPAEWREIVQRSDIFARLHTETMFCFTSKYALALYEMVQKRGNLKHKNTEDFGLDEMRGLLRVPRDRLTEYADLRRFALIPAVNEVNAFSPYMVQLDAIRHGKKVAKLRLILLRGSTPQGGAQGADRRLGRGNRWSGGRAVTIQRGIHQEHIRIQICIQSCCTAR